MKGSLLAATAGCLGMLGAACAPGQNTVPPSTPTVVFPSRDELAKIPSRTPHVEAFGTNAVVVDTWTFEAAAASDASAYDDPSPWGEVARQLVKGREGTLTLSPAMHCTALELARFHAKNGAMPTESLRRFTAARCGSLATSVSPMFWSVTTPGAPSDEELATKAQEAFLRMSGDHFALGHRLLGVGAARDGQRITAVAVVAEDEARLEPGSLGVDASRRVTLQGSARGEYTAIFAMINHGDVSDGVCQSDPHVKPPRFALTCELAPGDPFAWVEILGQKSGKLLLHELGETLVHEGDGSAIAYAARHVGPPAPVTGAADFSQALFDRLNAVRTGAHLTPLTLAAKQSAENARLAGTLVDASFGFDDATADRAAIGLMAGWNVPGLIRNGAFFLAAVGPTNDATAWLDYALERPMGRLALLDPSSEQIAIGPTFPPGGGALGAAVTTYAMFDAQQDHAADATRFFQRLVAARAARGLPAPVRVQGLGEMDVELDKVQREGKAPMAALDVAMQVAVERTGQGVRGYSLETNDLDKVDVPGVLLTPGPLRVMVGVTHHRANGAAWGQYVVLVVILGAG
jgi:hypothetical protein